MACLPGSRFSKAKLRLANLYPAPSPLNLRDFEPGTYEADPEPMLFCLDSGVEHSDQCMTSRWAASSAHPRDTLFCRCRSSPRKGTDTTPASLSDYPFGFFDRFFAIAPVVTMSATTFAASVTTTRCVVLSDSLLDAFEAAFEANLTSLPMTIVC